MLHHLPMETLAALRERLPRREDYPAENENAERMPNLPATNHLKPCHWAWEGTLVA